MTKIDRTAIAAAAARQGAERIRITRAGEVHAYGRMPGSIITGWYLMGYADELLQDIAAGHR